MYFFEIKNDLALGNEKYAPVLKKYLQQKQSKLNDDIVLKGVFFKSLNAYDVIKEFQKYGY